jgi:hypothetical protein
MMKSAYPTNALMLWLWSVHSSRRGGRDLVGGSGLLFSIVRKNKQEEDGKSCSYVGFGILA